MIKGLVHSTPLARDGDMPVTLIYVSRFQVHSPSCRTSGSHDLLFHLPPIRGRGKHPISGRGGIWIWSLRSHGSSSMEIDVMEVMVEFVPPHLSPSAGNKWI